MFHIFHSLRDIPKGHQGEASSMIIKKRSATYKEQEPVDVCIYDKTLQSAYFDGRVARIQPATDRRVGAVLNERLNSQRT